jgi:uncharacterized protein YdcH (DUF465 family)
MFHEYREDITQIKQDNAHFSKIFDKHNDLDEKIRKASDREITLSDIEIEVLKKEKLLLKDEIYMVIIKHRKENMVKEDMVKEDTQDKD